MFNASDATYMLTLLDGGMTYLDTLSVRYSEDRHVVRYESRQIVRDGRGQMT